MRVERSALKGFVGWRAPGDNDPLRSQRNCDLALRDLRIGQGNAQLQPLADVGREQDDALASLMGEGLHVRDEEVCAGPRLRSDVLQPAAIAVGDHGDAVLLCAKQSAGCAENEEAERRRDQGAQSWWWTDLRYAKSSFLSTLTTLSASSLWDEGMKMRTVSRPAICVRVRK